MWVPQNAARGIEMKQGGMAKSLIEYSDVLNRPVEAGIYDSEQDDYLPVAPHWHYYMEIIFVETGSIRVENDGEIYHCRKGDLLLVRPEAVHAIYAEGEEHTVYRFVKFDANCVQSANSYVPKLDVILRNVDNGQHAPMLLREETIYPLHFGEHLARVHQELQERRYGYDLMVQSYLGLLLVKIMRIWRRAGIDMDSAVLADSDKITLHNITAYIDAHAGEELRVEQLAGLCSMSYSYFAKSFHNLYGRSCKEYIEFIRISKAEELLLFTDCDLSYISQETGFADSSHLIKTFRRLKGMTPRQYKLHNRSKKVTL